MLYSIRILMVVVAIKKVKDSVRKVLEDICLEQDLLDIWRVRNPMTARFT